MNIDRPQSWSDSARAAVEQLRRYLRVHGPRSTDGWVRIWAADDPDALDRTARIVAAHMWIALGEDAVQMRRTDDSDGLWSLELRSLLCMPPSPRPAPPSPDATTDPDQSGRDN